MDDMRKAYGTALFTLACESGQQDAFASALDMVTALVEENPLYLELLSSPSISLAERLSAVEEALGSFCPEYVTSFVKLLCEKGHVRSLPGCVEEFRRLLEASRRISTARVVSAVELTAQERERIVEQLEKRSGNTVVLDTHVDPSLMGGVIVEVDGMVMDGSLRRRLQEVKDVMSR